MTQSTNSTAQLSGPDNQNLPHANRTPEELEAALREDIADFDATMTAHGSRGQGTSSRARGSGQSRGQARGTVTCCGRVGRGRGPARGGITGVVSWNTFPAGSNAEGNLDLDESVEPDITNIDTIQDEDQNEIDPIKLSVPGQRKSLEAYIMEELKKLPLDEL
ncbi:hypothetical protein MJO28_001616 [Puccinia striiformis f. sp. tritici]|uniref:Uncharacterized protein n=1 Tax=Puccinia striiformis f. sp. tritici TaxID=168172 RepID=A0ACC0EUK5_9BASI|nr:hypothetical protein MJO28_001616 [Puccinia striiformis f. sp. tritici]KAI9626166.1 hypothetical protein H4Q26_015915 [Puccinia striiformis f. sp. tritici PST-130]